METASQTQIVPLDKHSREYIYPNDYRPGEVMKRTVLDITGVSNGANNVDIHYVYHEDGSREIIGPGWINVIKVNQCEIDEGEK